MSALLVGGAIVIEAHRLDWLAHIQRQTLHQYAVLDAAEQSTVLLSSLLSDVLKLASNSRVNPDGRWVERQGQKGK